MAGFGTGPVEGSQFRGVGMTDYGYTDLVRQKDGFTLSVIDYWDTAQNNIGSPGESAVVRVEKDGEEALVRVFWMVSFRHFDPAEPKQWVTETWGFEVEKEGDQFVKVESTEYLFQYSTTEEIRMEQLFDDIMENAHWILDGVPLYG